MQYLNYGIWKIVSPGEEKSPENRRNIFRWKKNSVECDREACLFSLRFS